jgi:V/A-type H+-transporting ATPase subunit A
VVAVSGSPRGTTEKADGRGAAAPGRVTRVNGPLVQVEGLGAARMLDVVEIGDAAIRAETVALAGSTATLQAYEYTGGVRVGDVARGTGLPLSASLGPGLLGRVFDGLLRPLSSAPVWLTPRRRDLDPGTQEGERWAFRPDPDSVTLLGSVVGPGTRLGTVAGSGSLEHRVVVPPGARGVLSDLAPGGLHRGEAVIARVGGRPVHLVEPWPVRRPRPFEARVDDPVALHTGQRVIDLLFPLTRGSAAAVPGGFGTGKTLLLQQIAKWCDADVIVYVGCGERGNEMADVLAELRELPDARTGGRLADRSVIIANTSNMPMMAREASIYTGITVAEYFRDMGYDAVVIADSTSRWAEALREFASRTGALPAEEGYPADLASALAAFYERAGRVRTLAGDVASVTVIGAVSPPGGDLTEPVTTATERFVAAVWSLDRDLAYSRHYPAVSWSGSFSREVEALGAWHAARDEPEWTRHRARAAALLAEADRLSALAEILGTQALPGHERMVLLAGRLLREGVLMQSALSATDAYCSAAKAQALLAMVLDVAQACDRLIEQGVPATTLEELDLSDVVRAREETGPQDAAGVGARRDQVLARLEALA